MSGALTRGIETITVTYQTFTTTFTCLVYDEIVSGYGRVKYIQTSGALRINTNIRANVVRYAEIDVLCITMPTSSQNPANLLGSGGGNSNHSVASRENIFRWRWGFSSYKDFSVTMTDRHTLTITIPTTYSVGTDTATVTCDESSGTVQKGQSYALPTSYMVIFGNHDGSTFSTNTYQNKLYECVLKDVNDNYLFNGIPAIRMSDKVAGIYDQATNTFFPSDTSTNFLYA